MVTVRTEKIVFEVTKGEKDLMFGITVAYKEPNIFRDGNEGGAF